jgi:hypothetical protein
LTAVLVSISILQTSTSNDTDHSFFEKSMPLLKQSPLFSLCACYCFRYISWYWSN